MEDTVGVRELRQNLSVYLRRVADGETLRVTDRGRPVAVLAPLPAPRTTLERLIAEGRVMPALQPEADLPRPLPPVPGDEKTLSEVLQGLRDEEQR